MACLVFSLHLIALHWPIGSFPYEAAKLANEADERRDQLVAELMLSDLLARRDPPVFVAVRGRANILFSQMPPARKVTVPTILERKEPKEWEKLSSDQLELVRQAAIDLVRRLPKKNACERFAFKDSRVQVIGERETSATVGTEFPDRPELVRAYAPGYSPDKRVALLRVTFTAGHHGGVGTYVLARKSSGWMILLREFQYFM
jgi:hypothetical protein